MVALPAAAVLLNNEVVPQVRDMLVTQLHINIVLDGYAFEQEMTLDGYFLDRVRAQNKRVLVIRDAREHAFQNKFDVVLYFYQGLVSVEMNNFGPPGGTFKVPYLTWGQLNVFETQIGYTAPQKYYPSDFNKSGGLFKNYYGTWDCTDVGCTPKDVPLTRKPCNACGFPYGPFRGLNHSTRRCEDCGRFI